MSPIECEEQYCRTSATPTGELLEPSLHQFQGGSGPRCRPSWGRVCNKFLQAHRHRIADRQGKAVATLATARKIVILVYDGLRDGAIRCLAETG